MLQREKKFVSTAPVPTKMSISAVSFSLLILGCFPSGIVSRPDEVIIPESFREAVGGLVNDPTLPQNVPQPAPPTNPGAVIGSQAPAVGNGNNVPPNPAAGSAGIEPGTGTGTGTGAGTGRSLENPNQQAEASKRHIEHLQNLVSNLTGEVKKLEKENLVLREVVKELEKKCKPEKFQPRATISRENQIGVNTTATACEYTALKLTCETGLIKITRAMYGRVQEDVCKEQFNAMFPNYSHPQALNCTGNPGDLGVVQKICDSKKTCAMMAANSLFGDPCVYTLKYLEVDYQCQQS